MEADDRPGTRRRPAVSRRNLGPEVGRRGLGAGTLDGGCAQDQVTRQAVSRGPAVPRTTPPVGTSLRGSGGRDAVRCSEVSPTYRQPNANLRTQFVRILKRASIEPWERLFQNLRASRETELANEYLLHVVTAWLGNTEKVAGKYHL